MKKYVLLKDMPDALTGTFIQHLPENNPSCYTYRGLSGWDNYLSEKVVENSPDWFAIVGSTNATPASELIDQLIEALQKIKNL